MALYHTLAHCITRYHAVSQCITVDIQMVGCNARANDLCGAESCKSFNVNHTTLFHSRRLPSCQLGFFDFFPFLSQLTSLYITGGALLVTKYQFGVFWRGGGLWTLAFSLNCLLTLIWFVNNINMLRFPLVSDLHNNLDNFTSKACRVGATYTCKYAALSDFRYQTVFFASEAFVCFICLFS